MKHLGRNVFLAVVTLIGLGGFAISSSAQNPLTFDWKAFGQGMNRGPKVVLRAADAKLIVARVADQMIKMKVVVNNGWGGRISSKAQYGQQDIGTCSWINDAIQKALYGAGFRKDQIFGVIGVGASRGKVASAGLWLNIEHIAPAVVIGGQVLTFDLWQHAYSTGGYAGMSTSTWNGRSLSGWCTGVQHYPGFEYRTFDGQIPDPPMHPSTLQDAILESQYFQRFPEAKAKKPAKLETKAKVSRSCWSLVETKSPEIKNEPNARDPRRYDRVKAVGGPGKLVVTSEWNDMALNPHSCSATLVWSTDADMQNLIPGQKFKIRGSVQVSGETDRSSIGLNWHPAGFPAHVGHSSGINIFGADVFGLSKSFETEATVPDAKQFPDGSMVLRFLTYARGMGALEYRYKWTPKE